MPYRHPIGDPIDRPAEPAEVVRASIDIAAPASDVFRALAEPSELAAWLGGADPAPASPESPNAPDARPAAPASRWEARVVAPDGTVGVVTGEYGHVAPPHLLETTWRASWNDFVPERVRFELVPIDVGGVAGTRVTVTHTRAAMQWRAPSHAFAGAVARADVWPTFLARLAAYVGTTEALGRWDVTLHRAVVELHHAK
jgi:uncharacterized protein YndB with AHSA1/START domain